MKNIDDWLNAYGESHQNSTNKIIHWFCVPIITFTLLGLLSLVNYEFTINSGIYNINLAGILFIIAILFYLKLSVSLTIGMFLFTGICLTYINRLESLFNYQSLLKYYLIIFIIAWVGQFIGHKIEGKKPSFFEDIQFLLIGPAWLLSFIYKKLNIPI
jgi:uncharacterized membrane protein YGL010W